MNVRAPPALQWFASMLFLAAQPLVSDSQRAGAAPTLPAASAGNSATTPSIEAGSGRAWQNWALNCQGCHLADGQGTQETGKLSGTVAKFLSVSGGREYLVRVPGVATSALPDDELAELINWVLVRFDKQDIPRSFRPFTPTEVGRLRTQPLRLEVGQTREGLLKKVDAKVSAAGRPTG